MSNEEILDRIWRDVIDIYDYVFSKRNIAIWMTKGLFNLLFPGEFILQKEDIATITLFGCSVKDVIFPYAGEQWIVGYDGTVKEE